MLLVVIDVGIRMCCVLIPFLCLCVQVPGLEGQLGVCLDRNPFFGPLLLDGTDAAQASHAPLDNPSAVSTCMTISPSPLSFSFDR